jgi:hypothetical protein
VRLSSVYELRRGGKLTSSLGFFTFHRTLIPGQREHGIESDFGARTKALCGGTRFDVNCLAARRMLGNGTKRRSYGDGFAAVPHT